MDQQKRIENTEYDMLYGNASDADQLRLETKKWEPKHLIRRARDSMVNLLGSKL